MQARIRSLTIVTAALWLMCAVFASAIQALTIDPPARDSVKITFDRNEGSSAFDRILKEYGTKIKGLVQLQLSYPNSRLTVSSNADGVRYFTTHNEKNAVKSLERLETGNDLLAIFGADLHRVINVPMTNESDTGMAHRYIVITFIPGDSPPTPPPTPPNVKTLEPLVCEPPKPVAAARSPLRLHLGLGYGDTPFGGTPHAVGALSYRRWLYVEAQGSHALGNEQWSHQGVSFDTHVRSASVNVIAFPSATFPVGVAIGFSDSYRINDATGEYVQRFLSPTYGLRGRIPLDTRGFWEVALTATVQPGTRSTVGTRMVEHLSYGRIAGHLSYTFGGSK